MSWTFDLGDCDPETIDRAFDALIMKFKEEDKEQDAQRERAAQCVGTHAPLCAPRADAPRGRHPALVAKGA